MKILIVEDETVQRMTLQNILMQYGTCQIATDGLQAVEMFKTAFTGNDRYDLVCMDLKMPNLDGKAALKQIRDFEVSQGVYFSDGVKVIMITAYGDMPNILESFHELCDSFLVKPYTQEQLIKQIKDTGILKDNETGVHISLN